MKILKANIISEYGLYQQPNKENTVWVRLRWVDFKTYKNQNKLSKISVVVLLRKSLFRRFKIFLLKNKSNLRFFKTIKS